MNQREENMTEEAIEPKTPAGAEGMQESAPTEAKQEQSSRTFTEKMFNLKSKPKDDAPKTDSESSPNNQPLNGDGVQSVQQKPKSAKDRIQELAREKNAYKEQAESKSAEVDRLKAEIQKYKDMKPDEMTARDQIRAIQAEDKMNEIEIQTANELHDYIISLDNSDEFIASYDYYAPLLLEQDPWTVKQIHNYPEKFKMYDVMFQAMNNGVFRLGDWLATPNPIKLQKIKMMRDIARGDIILEDAPAPVNAKKKIPDSVVPDLKSSHEPQRAMSEKAMFERTLRNGR
jgi:hypothetical protein